MSVSTTGGGLALAPVGVGVAASVGAAAGGERAGLERREPDEPTPPSIGRFRVLDELGRGGMGVVYAAYDEELDRKVAIKLIRWDAAYTAVARARMRREAQALAQLSHPNVVQIYDSGNTGS